MDARGSIEHIFVAPAKAKPVQSVASVVALAGEGLRGDRYTLAKNRRAPDYQVTLIESENIEAFTEATGLPLAPGTPRRNIVTRGVRLNDLCGKRFRVGAAVFEGLELCEPCAIFAKFTYREALKFFVHKGGLRARIVEGGELRVGDFVGTDPLPRHAGLAVLRRVQVSDLAVFQDYRHDPLITRYQDWYGTRTDAEATAFLEKMNAQQLLQPGICTQVGIAEPEQLSLVGDIGLTLAADGRSAEIGYSLRPAAQGRGIGTAAVREVISMVFELTDAKEVRAIVDPVNVRSIRLLERVGMHMVESCEGTFRDAPCIDHLYAISRPR